MRVKQHCPIGWTTFCKNKSALVSYCQTIHTACSLQQNYCLKLLKKAISLQAKYEPGDCNLLRFLQKIEIEVRNIPEELDSKPLELEVEGLNVPAAFQFSPGEIALSLLVLIMHGILFCRGIQSWYYQNQGMSNCDTIPSSQK